VKFTIEGEVQIILSSHAQPNQIEVSVKDSGIGIDPHQAEKLFKPFVQAEDPLNRRFGGTGLGLALSKKLARLLGGDLWLKSSVPGEGSTFSFSVADKKEFQIVDKAPAASSVLVKEKKSPIDFENLNILAAEDSLDNQNLLSIFLQPTKARLTFAQNGTEAVRLAMSRKFDLILMDIQMPEMDGFEAVSLLRDQGWIGPIVALSAHAHSPEKERALKNGFNDYLTKPISKEKLWERISFHTG
jgi:CheY-like chemotaxis protein